jgi:ADP-ribose pyrophosphatase
MTNRSAKEQSKKWRTLSSTELYTAGFFRLRSDQCELPDGRVMPKYYVMEFPDWVNVVPVTEDNRIVLVEQYRQASGELCLEIPGGSTHAHEQEEPKKAALRELLEETGYVPDDLRLIGVHQPNPAMQNNRMHTFLALNCRKMHEPQLDPFEDIRVVTHPVHEVIQMIFEGTINHSIVVASLLYALPTLGFHLPQR